MSELLVNTIKKADGTGSLSVPAESGTVVTTASPSLGRRNLILNGSMAVAQRGTSSTAGGYQTVDRFKSEASGGTITQSQENLTSGAPFDLGFRKFYRLTNTGNSTATSSYRQMIHFLESQDVANSGWNYLSTSSAMTISFWARSSLAGTYYFTMIESNGGSNPYHTHGFALAADTWTKVEYTFYGNANLTFDNDNAAGLQLYWRIDLGTDYTGATTEDEWVASSSNITPDFTQDFSNTTNATFDLTGVQLEVGSVATPFEHRSYGEELALCQRYWQQSYSEGTSAGTNTLTGFVVHTSWGDGAGYHYGTIPLTNTMRASPSVTFYTHDGTIDKWKDNTSTNRTITANQVSTSIVSYQFGTITAGSTGQAYGQYVADAEL